MNSTKIYIGIIALLTLFSSCVKDLSDLNIDPNNSENPDPHLLFKFSVKRGMGGYITASNLEFNGLDQWVMYFALRGGIEPGNPYLNPSGGDSYWNETYVQSMNNAMEVIRIAEDDAQLKNMGAAALIWKTYQIQRITDLWGDVPYSEAFKGSSDLEFTPSYDTQAQIYQQMIEDLEKAVEMFDKTLPFFTAESDLIYQGDIDGWIRFANSLRLRMAIRILDVDPVLAESTLEDLTDLELISSNNQNAEFWYNSVYNKPLYEAGAIRAQEGTQYMNPSKFLVDMLLNLSDPRTPFIVEKTALSTTFPFIDEYRGVPNLLPYTSEIWDDYNLDAQLGDPLGEWGDVSRIGKWYLNNDRPVPMLSYSEVCLLKAEAIQRGVWSGDLNSEFKSGVRSAMENMSRFSIDELTISEADIVNYLNQFTQIGLKEIITQKWIMFVYENVFEAYADYRRTGFPQLTDYNNQPIDSESFPKRLRYPYSEYTLNRDNYLNAIMLQGPDDMNTYIWWNKP